MTILTIHLKDEKSKKAIKAVLDALDIKYEAEEQVTFPDYIVAGVLKAKEDIQLGRVKKYKGLNAVLNRCSIKR